MKDPISVSEQCEDKVTAPPVSVLDGRQIGLFDNGKRAAEPVLTAVRERLADRHDVTFSEYSVRELNQLKDDAELARIQGWAADIDACIAAMGDCGSCTKFLVRAADAIEEAGTPAVGLIAEGFELDWKTNASDHGRSLRYRVIPVASETTDLGRIREQMTRDVVSHIEAEVTTQNDGTTEDATDTSPPADS